MKQYQNKKIIIAILVILVFLTIFVFNIIRQNKDDKESQKAISQNIEKVAEFYQAQIPEIESKIDALESGSGEPVSTGPNYRKIFENCAIIGDSITEGLSAYQILGEEQVFTTIGASVMHNGELFTQAAGAYPKNAFFSFGMNDMGICSGDVDMFIDEYTKKLKAFRKASPKSKIYVSSISTPSEEAIKSNEIYGKYTEFNSAIKKMCKDENFIYIDNTSILKSNPELYGGDGIHVDPAYYPVWLDLMAEKAGLK